MTAGMTAFDHALIRGCKPDKPFLLMESTPSLVNWHEYNKLKRPGVNRMSAIQTVACGADGVQYFQWRKGRGGSEQFHGAVVDHDGRDDSPRVQRSDRHQRSPGRPEPRCAAACPKRTRP